MKVYVVQGEHPAIPGRVISAHSDLSKARKKGVEIINMILTDMRMKPIPQSSTLEEIEQAVEKINTKNREFDMDCDVWVTELEID